MKNETKSNLRPVRALKDRDADLWQAVLRHLKRKRVIITDAERSKIAKGPTPQDKLLLLGEVLDSKGITFTEFFE